MEFTMYARFLQTLEAYGPEQTAQRAKQMGFSSVEILETTDPGHPCVIPDVTAAKQVRRIFEAAGLRFACYSVGTNLYHNPQAEQSLCRHAEIASALGAPYLHHTSLPWLQLDDQTPDFEQAIETAADAAARVARFAAPLGITCIYEDQGMYVNGLTGFGRFFSEMKNRCHNVGICADVGNILFVDEGPVPFFQKFHKDICHVHLKDYLRKPGPQSPGLYWLPTKGGNWVRDTMVGHGVIDLAGCIRVLKETGYNGALALELEHPEPFEEGVRQAMDYIGRFLQ